MKNILLINTGGTIASVPGPSGLSPAKFRGPKGDVLDLLSLDSTDIAPKHWLAIAGAIRENYEKYDGFVITHGTDTLSFTAAGLSVLIGNSRRPIVLTGSQIPAYREDSDAHRNLECAYAYASSGDAFGVHVVFAGHVIDGSRARKIRTGSFDAFVSVNAPDDAFFEGGDLHIRRGAKDPEWSCTGSVVFHDHLNENVAILRLYPGIKREFAEYLYRNSDGLVLETFGCGGIPAYIHFEEIVKNAKRQIPVIVCTQVLYEGTDLARYEVGQRLLALPGIREGGLMTAEAAAAHLMLELAQK